LEICLYLDARYTANFVPNIAHILRFTLCELWSRTYTMYLQLRIFRLQYSTERICVAIEDMSTIQCALYRKPGAKYSAHGAVYPMWTVVPDIYNVIAARHIQASVLNWTYLRYCWRHLGNSMRVMIQIWCHIKYTSSSLRYVNFGSDQIQYNNSTAYSEFNIKLNISALLLELIRHFDARYTVNFVPNTALVL
jgi:hypothetical protein